jgi:hypothetical protein
VVLVTARGHRGRQLALRVPEGPAAQDVPIPALEAGTEMVLAPIEAPPHAEAAPHRSNARLVLGLVGIGVGVAGAGVGTYFGMRTFSKKNEAASHCVATECDATGVSLEADAHQSATVSTVAFVAGGASLALGTWLTLTSGSSAVTAGLQPLVGPRTAALGLGGAW